MSSQHSRDYYLLLEIERHANDAEIKAAYRKLALRFHPDRNPGDKEAEERFKAISEAYAVLSDADKRAHFDRFGQSVAASPFAPGADLSAATDFFDAILGDLFGLDRNKKAGQDLRYTLELSFEEAALGATKSIHFERAEDCADCVGTGAQGGAAGLVRCSKCDGDGFFRQKGMLFSSKRPCAACGGAGEFPKVRCKTCLGGGLVDREKAYDVRVPSGATDGSAQRIAGQGAPGRRGGAAGDLHILLRVKPHPFFREESGSVTCDLPISIADAVLGAEVLVPLLEGAVRMKIPAGTQSGATFRIRGRGMSRDGNAAGDILVRMIVETPIAVDDASKELFEQLRSCLPPTSQPKQQAFADAAKRRNEST
jgi:molecular chaperone DnaJ